MPAERSSQLGLDPGVARDARASIRNVGVQVVTYQQLTGFLERKLSTWDWIDSSTNERTQGSSHRKETQ